MIVDPLIMPAALTVLTQLMTELGKTATGAPLHARITPGEAVVASVRAPGSAPMSDSTGTNECCEGIASVRVVSFFPTAQFPQEDQRPASVGGPVTWAVELELMVIRCGSQPGPDLWPTDAQLTADAQVQQDDAAAMRRVGQALQDNDVIMDHVLGRFQPASGDGGCLGGSIILTIQVDACEVD